MRLEFLLLNAKARDKFEQIWQRSAFLLTVVILYLIVGGLFFMLIEGPTRQATVEEAEEDLERERARLLEVLWGETIANTEDDWASIANEKLDIYEKMVKDLARNGIDMDDGSVDDDNPWSFVGALFYCYTVITTIGYGNIYPETAIGKLATIPYAAVGVPLMLIYLGEVGRLLTLALRALLKRRWPADFGDASDDSFDFTPYAAIGITGAFITFGAVLFRLMEGSHWSLIDAAYFSFVTFSTVGFGDLVPSSEWLMVVLVAYSVVSLSLCGMLFVVVQAKLEQQLAKLESRWRRLTSSWREMRLAAARKKKDDLMVRSTIVEEDEYEVEDEEEES